MAAHRGVPQKEAEAHEKSLRIQAYAEGRTEKTRVATSKLLVRTEEAIVDQVNHIDLLETELATAKTELGEMYARAAGYRQALSDRS